MIVAVIVAVIVGFNVLMVAFGVLHARIQIRRAAHPSRSPAVAFAPFRPPPLPAESAN